MADIVLPITGIINAVSVDVDIAQDVVYWSDDATAGIYRAPLTGGEGRGGRMREGGRRVGGRRVGGREGARRVGGREEGGREGGRGGRDVGYWNQCIYIYTEWCVFGFMLPTQSKWCHGMLCLETSGSMHSYACCCPLVGVEGELRV